jgi:hypothetical protein
MKKFKLKNNTFYSLKLKDNLYTLCYMIEDVIIQCFDIQSVDGLWDGSHMTTLKPLFRGYVGKSVSSLIDKELDSTNYTFDRDISEDIWIRPGTNVGEGFVFKGGDLVKVLPGKDYFDAPVLKKNLSLPEDRDAIEKYELVNMWGPDDLRERLIRYFEKGINRDDLKFEVFLGLWNDREELRPLTSRLPIPLR